MDTFQKVLDDARRLEKKKQPKSSTKPKKEKKPHIPDKYDKDKLAASERLEITRKLYQEARRVAKKFRLVRKRKPKKKKDE